MRLTGKKERRIETRSKGMGVASCIGTVTAVIFAVQTVLFQPGAAVRADEVDSELHLVETVEYDALGNMIVQSHDGMTEGETLQGTAAEAAADAAQMPELERPGKAEVLSEAPAALEADPAVQVVVDKNLTEEDGQRTITLEQYITGEIEEEESVIPTDVVLVLDYSYSMEGAAISRLNEATIQFIRRLSTVNEELPEEERARLGIIAFGGEKNAADATEKTWGIRSSGGTRKLTVLDNSSETEAISFVSSRTTTLGNTWTDAGLAKAQEFLSYDSAGRGKVVILVTDGYPYHEVSQGNMNSGDTEADRQAIMALGGGHDFMFTLSAANRALHTAYELKQSGTKIYTCYISNGVTEDSPSFAKYMSAESLAELPDDTGALGFRFMHMISSGNPGAYQLLTPTIYNREDATDPGAVNDTYFKVAETLPQIAVQLNRIYGLVLGDVLGSYRSGVTVVDKITWPFELDDLQGKEKVNLDLVPVKTYTADRIRLADGSFSFADRKEITGLEIYRESNRVEVYGFDYAENAVTELPHAGTDADYGRKLIVEFPIRARKSFGGNQVTTNEADSGLYNGGTALALYPVPRSDIPIDYKVVARDQTIYVPEKPSGSSLVETEADGSEDDARTGLIFDREHVPDGSNNAFVDIEYELIAPDGRTAAAMEIPHGAAYLYDTEKQEGNYQWKWLIDDEELMSGTYRVTATVTPVAEAVRKASSLSEGSQNTAIYTEEAMLYIFRPVIITQDTILSGPHEEDGVPVSGDLLDFEPGTGTIPSDGRGDVHSGGFRWVCDVPGAAARETEPGLDWTLTPVSGTTLRGSLFVVTAQDGEDIPVRASVSRIVDGVRKNIPDDQIEWEHTCVVRSEEACTYASYHEGEAGSGNEAGEASTEAVRFLIHVEAPLIPKITKSTAAPQIDPGEEAKYQVRMENTSGKKLRAQMVDVFPKDGDANGSSFEGILALQELRIDCSGAEHVLQDMDGLASVCATSSRSVYDESSDGIRSVSDWTELTLAEEDGMIVCRDIPDKTTAIRISAELESGEAITAQLSFLLYDTEEWREAGISGGQSGERIVNRALVMTDRLLRYSEPVTVEVADRMISGTVWEDENGNGIRDAAEKRMPDVKVTLYRVAGGQDGKKAIVGTAALDEVYDSSGSRIPPVMTDEDGSYRFHRVPPGTYYILFGELDEGARPTTRDSGEDDAVDSDAEEKLTENGEAYIQNLELTKGVKTLENNDLGLIRSRGRILIHKEIDRKYLPFGQATFLFRANGPEGSFYVRQLTIAENSTEGEVLFDELPYGEYLVSEIPTARYRIAETAVMINATSEDGGGSQEGSLIRTTLSAEAPLCEAGFINTLDRYDRFSHNDVVINGTGTDLPVSMEVTYTGPSPIVSEESTYTIPAGAVKVTILYDNGATRELTYDGSNLTLSPAVIRSTDNTENAPFPVSVYYTERGVTLKGSFAVTVQLKKLRQYQVIYLPNEGSFSDHRERNYVRYQYDAESDTASSIGGSYEEPSRDGFRFGGWSTMAAGGTYYPDDGYLPALGKGTAAAYTLYAQWLSGVTFYANGGVISGSGEESATENHRIGVRIGTALTAQWDDMHTFKGWNTAADGSGTWLNDYGILEGAESFYAIYEVRIEQIFNYTGGVQTFTAPAAGTYHLQVWGAQGGGGGKGGYSEGDVTLEEGEVLYICVGGAGGSGSGESGGGGGYNGGARGGNGGWTQHLASDEYETPTMRTHFGGAGGGGGATHIATNNRGTLSAYNSYRGEVLLVAGGGSKGAGNTGGGGSFGQGIAGRGTPASWHDAWGNGQQWGPDAGGAGGWSGGGYSAGGTGYIGGVQNGKLISGSSSMPVCGSGKVTGYQTGNSGSGHAKISKID